MNLTELMKYLQLPEWIPSLIALLSLPPFWLLLAGLGLWIFLRGRSIQRPPLEFIRYPVSHLGKDVRLPQPPPVRRGTPFHDGSLWLFAFVILMLLCFAIVAVDFLLRAQGAPQTHPIEERILTLITRGYLTSFPRPYAALPAYALIGYVMLEAINLMLLGMLSPGREKDGAVTRWLFRACGFVGVAQQRLAFPLWHLNILPLIVVLLAIADVAVVFFDQTAWIGTLATAHLFPMVLSRFFDMRSLENVQISIEFSREIRRRTLEDVVADLARDGHLLTDSDSQKVREWRVSIPTAPVTVDPDRTLPARLTDALRVLIPSDACTWYLHQHRAWEAFQNNASLVLSLPAGAGRTTWIVVVALATALDRMQTVCVISHSSVHLEHLSRLLHAARDAMMLPHSIPILNLNGAAHPLASLTTFPQILMGTPAQMEALLTVDTSTESTLHRNLGLLAIDDLDAYGMEDMVSCENLCSHMRHNIRCSLVISCVPIVANQLRSLETLTGRPLTLIDEDTAACGEASVVMVAPPTAHRLREVLARPADEFTRLEWIVDALRMAEFSPHIDTSEPNAITQHLAETGFINVPHTATSTSVFVFTGHHVPNALGALRHAAIHARQPGASRHYSFWIINPHIANADVIHQLNRIDATLADLKVMPARFDWLRTWIPRRGRALNPVDEALCSPQSRPTHVTPVITCEVNRAPPPREANSSPALSRTDTVIRAGSRPLHLIPISLEVATTHHGFREWSLEGGVPLMRIDRIVGGAATRFVLTQGIALRIPINEKSIPWSRAHTELLAEILSASARYHVRDRNCEVVVASDSNCGSVDVVSLLIADRRVAEPAWIQELRTESILEILATSQRWTQILVRLLHANSETARTAQTLLAFLRNADGGTWEETLLAPHLAEALTAPTDEKGTLPENGILEEVTLLISQCLEGYPTNPKGETDSAKDEPSQNFAEDFAACLGEIHAWIHGCRGAGVQG